MIDAVSSLVPGAAAPAAAPATGDIFAQILAAVMTGLTAGAGSAEVAPEEAAAELPMPEGGRETLDEAAQEQAAAPLAVSMLAAAAPLGAGAAPETAGVPAEGKDPGDAARPRKTRDAATAAFLLASGPFAAFCRAAGGSDGALPERAVPAAAAVPGRANVLPEAAAAPVKEAPAVPGIQPAAGAQVPAVKEAAAAEEPGQPELKCSAPARAMPSRAHASDGELKTDLSAEEKAGRSGGETAAAGQEGGEFKGEAGKAAVRNLKEVPAEKTVLKDAFKPASPVPAFIKEQPVPVREPEAGARPGIPGHVLSAASVERLASAAGGLEAGNGKLSLELNESGLGKVRVEMAMSGGEVTISLQVEKGEAGRFLTARVPELVDALAQRGINSGVEVFSGNDGGRSGGGREGRTPSRRFNPGLENAPAQEAQAAEEGRLSLYA